MLGRLALSGLVSLVLVDAVFATDHLQGGQKLALKTSSGGGKLVFASKTPPVVLPAESPLTAGATLEIVNPLSGETATFALPAGGWTQKAGTLYKFTNKDAPAGPSPVKVAVM